MSRAARCGPSMCGRRLAVGLGPDPPPRRRSGRRQLGRRLAAGWRRQCLGADVGRCGAPPGVPADHQPEPGFLRRPAAGRQSLRRLRSGAERRHWRTSLELPDRASRCLGLRRRLATLARLDHARRRAARRRHPEHQARPNLCARPGYGAAGAAGRGTEGAAGRRCRRSAVADAAFSGRSAAAGCRPGAAGGC